MLELQTQQLKQTLERSFQAQPPCTRRLLSLRQYLSQDVSMLGGGLLHMLR